MENCGILELNPETRPLFSARVLLCHPTHHQVSARVGLCALWSSHLISSRERESVCCSCVCVRVYSVFAYAYIIFVETKWG